MVTATYGNDLSDEQIGHERARVGAELERTIAAFDGGSPVGGATAYTRMLTVPGAVMPVAGVTWVGVAATHRRRGILTAMMRKQLTDVHEAGHEPIAVLRPSEAAIYGRFGYGPATRGDRLTCDTAAMRFRPGTDFGEGTIRLLSRDEARPLVEKVYDLVRTGTNGWPDRTDRFWDARLRDRPEDRGGASAIRIALHLEPAGQATGYALYRTVNDEDRLDHNHSVVRVLELATVSRQAYAALWRFLAGIDLMPVIEYEAAVDEPLPHMLVEPRALRSSEVDRLWVRPVDVDRALAGRRYATALDLVLDVQDDFCPWNTGRYRLSAQDGTAACERTDSAADLRLTAAELGAAFLGGTTLASLAAAGLVEELRAGALARATIAFRAEREPFFPGGAAFPDF